MSAFNAQRERDRQLLVTFARMMGWEDNGKVVDRTIESCLDEAAVSPRVVTRVEQELVPLLDQLRKQHYRLNQVAVRSAAARVDTSIKLLRGEDA